ncbi:MAG: HAD-IB family phosphatase [Candidatus Aenigmarchaeota archaeon]|nr:HAD-IB family phosphatase [Candidatus Aenigmarchaeota archaeon]
MNSANSNKLIAFDLDGTLLKEESVFEILKLQKNYRKKFEFSKEIIQKYEENVIDASMEMNIYVCMFAGIDIEKCRRHINTFEFVLGVKEVAEVLKKEGYLLAILSDGFTIVADYVKEKLNFDYSFANELEVEDGILTGKLITPYNKKIYYSNCVNHNVCKRKVLTDLCKKLKIDLNNVVAVGNGNSDICFLEIAGKSIGFNPNEKIRKIADVSVKSNDLRDILPYIINR